MQNNIATSIPFDRPTNNQQVQMINVYIFHTSIGYRERHLVFYRLSTESPFPQGCIIFNQGSYVINYSPQNCVATIGEYFRKSISKLYLDYGQLDPSFTYIRLRQVPNFEDIRKQLMVSNKKADLNDCRRFYKTTFKFSQDFGIFEKIFKYHDVSSKSYQRVNSLLSAVDAQERDQRSQKILDAAKLLSPIEKLGLIQNRPDGLHAGYLELIKRHRIFMKDDYNIMGDQKRISRLN